MNDAQLSRFIVGIDLGTTNCAVSYCDLQVDNPEVQIFPLLQNVARGEAYAQENFPSFLYFCTQPETDSNHFDLPWSQNPTIIRGEFARRFGSATPDRLVHSAKSWLVHRAIDREARILPWSSNLDEQNKISPVEASAAYLKHIREAWNHRFGQEKDQDGSPCLLEDQQIVLTVPASFDEVAREFTLKAARQAGFKKITLMEEPLAAFYAWLKFNPNWQEQLKLGERILIVDIGGGTSDFSMIEVAEGGVLRRSTVGSHLLLGGDNIDITLANYAQQKAGKKFATREMNILIQECRRAKEQALSQDDDCEISLSVSSGGSSLLQGMTNIKMTRSEILELIENGFFPKIELGAKEPDRKIGLRTLGLPYERDPSIPAHLLAFLRRDGQICGLEKGQISKPSHILFNGGSMIPEAFRSRIKSLVAEWTGEDLKELNSSGLDTAVALGASSYGLARNGLGSRVKGGIARSYFLNISTAQGPRLVCIMPRDTDENQIQKLDHEFILKTNEIVQFQLYSSETRLLDKCGELIECDNDEISELPTLSTSIAFGRKATEVKVYLETSLNESGALELWLKSIDTEHSWQLRFDLRNIHEEGQSQSASSDTTLNEDAIKIAQELLSTTFSQAKSNDVNSIMKNLEAALELKRKEWSLPLCRRLADILLDFDLDKLRKSAITEARFYNLLGFLMRPGFGDSNDQFRVNKLWPYSFQGVINSKDLQTKSEWWILWRRCSGALNRGRQEQMAHQVFKELTASKALNPQVQREMWRFLGSLELSPIKLRRRILGLFQQKATKLDDTALWVISRIAARRPVYASLDLVLPPKDAASFASLLMQTKADKFGSMHQFCLSRLLSFTGNNKLDVADASRTQAIKFLEKVKAPDHTIRHLREVIDQNEDEDTKTLGDSLPVGLHLNS